MDKVALTIMASIVASVVSGIFMLLAKHMFDIAKESNELQINGIENKIEATSDLMKEKTESLVQRIKRLEDVLEKHGTAIGEMQRSVSVVSMQQNSTMTMMTDVRKENRKLFETYGNIIVKE